jgi:Phosphotransferase enzyme family
VYESSTHVPLTIEEITPAWITSCLRAGGHTETVVHVAHRQVIGGNAKKVLLAVEYDSPTHLPSGLCAKIGMELRDTKLNLTGSTYDTEGRFYLHMASIFTEFTPKCYSVILDPPAHRCAMLLEDLTVGGGRFGSTTDGSLSPQQAETIVQQLARLHGKWWGRTGSLPTVALPTGINADNQLGRYYARFDERYVQSKLDLPRGDAVPVRLRDAKALHDAFWAMANISRQRPVSLVHGDPHLGNVFIRPDGRVGMADWQTIRWNNWAYDIAYLVGSALEIDQRRSVERDMLSSYAEALQLAGGPKLSADELWTHYRQAMIYGLYGWLTCPDVFEYPEEVCLSYVTKFSAAVDDMDTIGALAGGSGHA